MKHLYNFFLFLLVCLTSAMPLWGTESVSSRIHLTSYDGLSNSSINCLTQDTDGLLWIGTWDGLNCYDGATILSFRTGVAGNFGLSNSVVRDIIESRDGFMWIVTDYGINRYNKYLGVFSKYYLGYDNQAIFRENAFDLCQDSRYHVIATAFNHGLFFFDNLSNTFKRLSSKGISAQGIVKIFFDKNNLLWIIYDQYATCCKLAPDGRSISKVAQVALPFDSRRYIYDGDKFIWVQSSDFSLHFIDIYSHRVFQAPTSLHISAMMNSVKIIDSSFYFCTDKGVTTVSRQFTKPQVLLPQMPVLSVLKDFQGIIWLGCDAQGVLGLVPKERFFRSYTPQEIPQLGIYAVRTLLRDNRGNLWVGSKGGGLLSIAYLGSDLCRTHSFTTTDGLASNSVFELEPASDGDFWIGCDGNGLSYFSARRQRLCPLTYTGNKTPPKISSVYAILATGEGSLWVGTSGNGLFHLFTENHDGNRVITDYRQYSFGKGSKALGSNIIYSLAMARDNRLWIATRGGGLNLLDISTDRISVFKNDPDDNYSLSCNDVISVRVDSRGNVWAGTTNGLNLLVDKQGKFSFRHFGENNGLTNNSIHDIIEDYNHQLWVTTNKGISRIDMKHNSIHSYYHDDGLQSDEFSDGAGFSFNGGRELYFGGINGFTMLHADKVKTSYYKPKLILSKFFVNNQAQALQDRYTHPVVLGYTENSLNFHFSILEFIDNNKCNISYRLVRNGNDKISWTSIGNYRDIILSNLVPGNYVLEVSYSNADNQWYMAAFKLPFVISPPWWLSIWAYLAYIFIIIAIIFAWFAFQKKKIEIKHNSELNKLAIQKEEDIHQAKLRFFTNIAHELSNCITLIYGPCERVINEGTIDDNSRAQLKTIHRNAERIKHLMQQIMDFRKAENGALALNFERLDVGEIVKYTLDYFSEISIIKKINVQLLFGPNTQWIVDRDAMEKIIFNLLSNAFKYSPESGDLVLELCSDPSALTFKCTNNGTIKIEDREIIFNRFKVLDNFETKLSQGIFTRNGIGLAMCKDLSKLMNGGVSVESCDGKTTFIVTIGINSPTPISHHTDTAPTGQPANAPASSMGNGKPTVLIIDDQAEIRQFIREILSHKYDILEAANGEEGTRIIADTMPDIIICDVVMPVMDGIAFLRLIKQDDGFKHIPVILLTSKSSIESRIDGLESGADMYIAKPFNPAYLQAAVDRVLSNKTAVREYLESPRAYTDQFMGRSISREDKEFIDKLMNILHRNLSNEDFSLEILANELAMSRVSLYRKIKELIKQTPSEFIRSYRLQEAEKLLRTSQRTVNEIMIMCGFQNKSYFYREFAKIYECTPKEYRNRQ